MHSRPQRPRSFWSAPRIATSGQVQPGSPLFTDFPSLCACPESSLANLIGSGLNLLCIQPQCRWTGPEVAILGADQKKRGLWGRECTEWSYREPGYSCFSYVTSAGKFPFYLYFRDFRISLSWRYEHHMMR